MQSEALRSSRILPYAVFSSAPSAGFQKNLGVRIRIVLEDGRVFLVNYLYVELVLDHYPTKKTNTTHVQSTDRGPGILQISWCRGR